MKMIRGRDAINEEMNKTNMDILKIDDGSSKLVRFLLSIDDVICNFEHTEQFGGKWKTVTCLDKHNKTKGECPLCLAGKNPGFKAYLPVIDRGDENKVKIIKASKEMLRQVIGMEDEYGDITARDFKIARSGQKLLTKYQFFPKDPKKEDLSGYDIPDIESRIAPQSRESIIAMMDGVGAPQTDDYNEADEGSAPPTGGGDKGKKYPF